MLQLTIAGKPKVIDCDLTAKELDVFRQLMKAEAVSHQLAKEWREILRSKLPPHFEGSDHDWFVSKEPDLLKVPNKRVR